MSMKDKQKNGADGGIRTPDPLITNQLPTELHRQNLVVFVGF